uniref:Uncharacterized protein n=1 Tax=Oryza brachyantha TaxID=4533 RepID=J3L6E1_ORYBR
MRCSKMAMRRNMEMRMAVAANPKEMASIDVPKSLSVVDASPPASAAAATGDGSPGQGLDLCPNPLMAACLRFLAARNQDVSSLHTIIKNHMREQVGELCTLVNRHTNFISASSLGKLKKQRERVEKQQEGGTEEKHSPNSSFRSAKHAHCMQKRGCTHLEEFRFKHRALLQLSTSLNLNAETSSRLALHQLMESWGLAAVCDLLTNAKNGSTHRKISAGLLSS